MVERNPTHRQARRSRSGCNTCRAKKVKCDELHPACGRCTRLHLGCEWPAGGPPLRERRRLQRVWRWREGFQPATILPKDDASLSSNSSANSLDGLNLTSDSTGSAPEPKGPPVFDFGSPGFPEALSSDPDFNFSSDNNNNNNDLDFNQNDNKNYNENILPDWQDLITTYPSIFFPDLSASSVLSGYNMSLPCSIVMTKNEHQALDHYSTTYSTSFTLKHPKWSTLSMIKNIAWAEPMIMHLLMAVSLKDLCWRRENENLRRSAELHYQHGTKLLADEMANQAVATKHVSILISFWFLYLYKTQSTNVDVGFLKKLSACALDHVQRYKLDSVCDIPTPLSQGNPEQEAGPQLLSAKEGSLIALMLICLYYQDIKYGFYHCGGKLAKYLNTNKQRLAQVYDLGKYAPVLNWAEEYPVQELVDDTQNYAILKLNNELSILLEDMNKEFVFTRHDPARDAMFSSELDSIKIRFAPVFALVNNDQPSISSSSSASFSSSLSPQSRTCINADLSVAFYHGVRIYLFRSTLQSLDVPTPPAVQESVDMILSIALRLFNSGGSFSSLGLGREDALFHRIEWPLFIAGVESKDIIHQDWIRQKMGERNTKVALERVLQEQQLTRLRVGVEFMRQVFCEDDRFRRSSAPGGQRKLHASDDVFQPY
ncbi:hypothetical protein UA08_00225 [Talaromyces atroroseus]|uniref:Zn(2)-C6 fungal-type domain-containing protein n=1 Tax=Talaromyces atroroseus TaxID=1441469 RepID=A0A225BCG1_TALAT|nr:hypothetical protein UA08_00225 [Talaromyces atroroseus]OKL63737.1 hypothetical protein UA08_00225 [Talaromyces atroroseus]